MQHAEAVDAILAQHVNSPVDGILSARQYYRTNLPDILGQVGYLLAGLDAITDPKERALRARSTLNTLVEGISKAMPHAVAFRSAIQADEDAQKLLKNIGASWVLTANELKKSAFFSSTIARNVHH